MSDLMPTLGEDDLDPSGEGGNRKRHSDEISVKVFASLRAIAMILAAVIPLVVTVVRRADNLEQKVNSVLVKMDDEKKIRLEEKIAEEKRLSMREEMLRLNHSSLPSCGSCKAMTSR